MEKSAVLIHGAFAGPWCMEKYAGLFRERGWTCHLPTLRYHDAAPGAEPDKRLATTSILDYCDDLAQYVEALDGPQILVGHAIGGVIAQKLAAKGLARGVVLLNSNVPWGMLPSTDDERFIATSLMSAGKFWDTAMHVEFDLMADYAMNKMPKEQQHETFEKLGAESGQAVFEMFFWMFDAKRAIEVDYAKVDCPVLVVSGSDDRAVPSSAGRRIAEKYGSSASYYLAEGHAHYLILEPGWEDVAGHCADWMEHSCDKTT